MRSSGQPSIVAARICDLVETATALEVRYTLRRTGVTETERASLVINCIGPETNCRQVGDPLVVNLLRRGLIRPGPADLGIDARPDGTVIDRDGSPSDILHTIGSPMKGVLWEVLAVPDIRVQARQLARRIIEREAAGRHLDRPVGR